MKKFKFFHGYVDKTLIEQWEELMGQYPTTITEWGSNLLPTTIPTVNPGWPATTNTPTWIVNPGLIQYTPNYTTYTNPNYTTITTTPGTGYLTIPYNGATHFTTTGTSLTTSNPNGITYTTGGVGGTLTTSTATFNSHALTSNFK